MRDVLVVGQGAEKMHRRGVTRCQSGVNPARRRPDNLDCALPLVGCATVGVLGLTEVLESSGLRLMTERFPTSPMPGAAAAVTRLPARQPLFGGGQGEFLIANF